MPHRSDALTSTYSSKRNDGARAAHPPVLWLRPADAPSARWHNLTLVVMRVLPVGIDVRQLRRDARQGQVSVAQLLDLIDKQEQTIQRLRRDNQRLQERLAQYEPEVGSSGSTATQSAETPSPSYSLDAEGKRRRPRRRRRKKSPGRTPTELKFAAADRTQNVYPDGVRHGDCQLVRERAVWRLEAGWAVHVGYRIFAAPGGPEPRIPGVTPRCEYGIGILVVLAFLVYVIGISLDKAFLRTRLAKWGFDPLPSKKVVDPVQPARNKLRMSFNSLAAIANFLGFNSKTEVKGDLWLQAALDGSTEALDYIVDHCVRDVLVLEKLAGVLKGTRRSLMRGGVGTEGRANGALLTGLKLAAC